MNIVVCVKYVPDATADRHFEADNTVDRVGVDGLLSELDEYAVEQALQVKEKADGEDIEVTVLTVGPEDAADAIRKALQMGADKGVHVVDDAIAGSDSLATSLVLAEAIKKIGDVDLVVCGMASTDGSWASSRRCWPSASASRRSPSAPMIEVEGDDVQDPSRRRHRHRDDRGHAAAGALGHRPVRRGPLPLLQGHHGREEEAAGDLVAGRPRCRRRCVGLAAAWTAVEGTEARPPRTPGEVVTDEDGSGATALVEFLASKKFI